MTPNMNHAIQAYRAASRFRSQRDQEADVFRRASAVLKAAIGAGPIKQVRALADNRRLWITVLDLMRDPNNGLPAPLRASIIAVGLAVQREMDREAPDIEFLVSINDSISEGLAGRP